MRLQSSFLLMKKLHYKKEACQNRLEWLRKKQN